MTSYKYLVTVTEEEANWLESHPSLQFSNEFAHYNSLEGLL